MKDFKFPKKHIIFLIFFLYTGTTLAQEPLENIEIAKKLYLPGNKVLSIISAAVSPDENTLAIGLEQKIMLYSLRELKTINILKVAGRISGEVTFSPDNKWVACSDIEGRFWIWLTANGKLVEFKKGFSEEGGSQEYIHSIAFNNDGNYFAVGSAGTEVFLWDTNSWKQIRLFNHYGNAMKVRFSPGDKYLGVSTGDISLSIARRMEGKIVIWNWKEKHSTFNSSGMFTGGILATAIAFSPDGQVIAGGNTDGRIGIWQISDKSLITKLKGHKDRIFDLSFSSNGKLLASASEDQNAIIWDTKQSKLLKRLPHKYRVLTAVFWENNNVLITADKKGINFWRISDGNLLGRLLALEGGKFVVFTPKGYFETDVPDYLQSIRQGNQQNFIKKKFHKPDIVSKILHLRFNKNGYKNLQKR